MERITIRLDDELLQSVDSYIDYISIKNRSDAIRFLLSKSLADDKIAVVLNKGTDIGKQDITKKLTLENGEVVPLATLEHSFLLKEQIKRLMKSGFNIIYLLFTPEIIKEIQDNHLLDDYIDQIKFHFIPNPNNLSSAAALKLLKGKINSEFLLIYSDILFDTHLNQFYKSFLESDALCSMTVVYSEEANIKGWVAIEGDRIINFQEKTKVGKKSIVAEPIFMFDPEIFNEPGDSLPYDIFPRLAEERKLGSFFTSSRIVHLHTFNDKEKFSIFFS